MELPASNEAISDYDRQLRERYGMEIVEASNNLFHNPTSPEAHRLYVEAIGKMLKNVREEHL